MACKWVETNVNQLEREYEESTQTVSYTHLDVYKRQIYLSCVCVCARARACVYLCANTFIHIISRAETSTPKNIKNGTG